MSTAAHPALSRHVGKKNAPTELLLGRGENSPERTRTVKTIIQPFKYEGNEVRTFTIDGEPWFVLKDVAAILELGNPRSSYALLDDDEKGVQRMDTLGGTQSLALVNESGLYSLVFRSRKPEAKAFKKWITSEVLPAIRRTGTYSSQPALPTTYLEALEELVASTKKNVALEAQAAIDAPKVAQAETYTAAAGVCSRQEFARELMAWGAEHGYRIYQAQVMEFLSRRLRLFVTRFRTDAGQATSFAIEKGYAVTQKGVASHNGHAYASGRLTGRGKAYAWARCVEYIANKGSLELPASDSEVVA